MGANNSSSNLILLQLTVLNLSTSESQFLKPQEFLVDGETPVASFGIIFCMKYEYPLHNKRKWEKIETEQFYKELLANALSVIPDTGAALVAGPMFIIRTPEENFALFEQARKSLTKKGIVVFDQLPYVDYNMKDAPFDYAVKFEVFYKGLIQSGKITACYLLPGWEQSQGTKTEVEYSKAVGIPIYEL